MLKFFLGIFVGLVISSVGLVTLANIIDIKLSEIILDLKEYESKGQTTKNETKR